MKMRKHLYPLGGGGYPPGCFLINFNATLSPYFLYVIGRVILYNPAKEILTKGINHSVAWKNTVSF